MPGEVGRAADSAARQRLRRAWLKAHRWLGLSLGLVLLVAAVTGSLMLVADPLDEAVNGRLFHVAGAPATDYEAVLRRLKAEVDPDASITLRPPRAPGESLQAIVRGAWSGTIHLHPSSAEVLGRRAETQGLMGFLFTLHSQLFAGEAGKAVLSLAALAYVVLFLSGIWLWWPRRWGQALAIRWSGSGVRTLFDLHRVSGALAGVLVLVSVVSGAYMAWPPLAASVTRLSGAEPVAPPKVTGGPARIDAVRTAVDRARAVFPGGMIGYVQVPARPAQPIRVRVRLADDPHPNGLSSVWAHPDSGEVVQVTRWTELDPGTRAYATLYPLHTGELWGLPWKVATFLVGVLLGGYALTGGLLWWRRRRPRREARLSCASGSPP